MSETSIRYREPRLVEPELLLADPHAAFARLRVSDPIIRIGEGRCLVLRARDVLALLNDDRTRQIEGRDYVALKRIPDGVVARFLANVFLFGDGAEHRAKRRCFAAAFSFAGIRSIRPKIRRVAERILAELPRDEPFDFVERVAARVPAEMIAEMLGLPVDDAPDFAAKVYLVSASLTPSYPLERHDEIERAAASLHDYLAAHLRARLESPRDDLLSQMAAAWDAEAAFSFDALVDQVMGIVLGGSDTTRAALAMTLALLLRHPDQWQAVRGDPSLIPGAIAEGLRYEPSVGTIPRFAAAPVRIDDVEAPAGSLLGLSTLSAMRDPDLYADPDRFDIRRSDHPRLHLVFGGGPHRCIGEMLARLEMEEALAALMEQAPEIRMTEAPSMIGFGGIRRIAPMIVEVGKAARG